MADKWLWWWRRSNEEQIADTEYISGSYIILNGVARLVSELS